MLNLNYIELIPVLINGIKEQQKLIEEKDDRISILEEKFAELESKLDDLSSRSSTSTIINQSEVTIASKDLASMEQNVPNPFNNVTTIDYSIQISATDAQINIFNIHGKLIKSVVIEHVGEGRLTINTADLPSGTYSYQLIVDKTPISTKKMVLTN